MKAFYCVVYFIVPLPLPPLSPCFSLFEMLWQKTKVQKHWTSLSCHSHPPTNQGPASGVIRFRFSIWMTTPTMDQGQRSWLSGGNLQ